MKKFLFALCGLVFGVSFAAADNIKMVTYFPVPYASYGDLGVAGTCDVGLLGSCKLDLGQGLTVSKLSSDSRPLNTGSLIVRNGKLALNSSTALSQLSTPSLISGGSVNGTGILTFAHDLSVNTIKSSQVQSLQATNRADLSQLYLFANTSDRLFPVCDDADYAISWKNLTVNGKSGVFLVCGSGDKSKTPCPTTCSAGYKRDPNIQYEEDGECCIKRTACPSTCPSGYSRNPSVTYEDEGECCIEVCQPPAGESSTRACPSGYTGTQTRTWNTSTCSWSDWTGECTSKYKFKYRGSEGPDLDPSLGYIAGPCYGNSFNTAWGYASPCSESEVYSGAPCGNPNSTCYISSSCYMSNMGYYIRVNADFYSCVEQ